LLGSCTGISFVDSTSLAVCHAKRIHSHRVFKGVAKRGKTTKGWFYGLKLHIVVNEFGELLGFMITLGNTSDLSVLPSITEGLFGKLFGDKGYISQQMFEKLFSKGAQLITKLKLKMKNKLMQVIDKIILRKRGMIDSVIQQLKFLSHIEHFRHRNRCNFMVNLLSGLIAYCLRADKPSIRLEKSAIRLLSSPSF
jgi:hypothetical protein